MYCYTHVNQFTCVFNELQLWTHISEDHPNFFKRVAKLSGINLPKPVIDNLTNIHMMFSKLHNDVMYLKRIVNSNPALYARNIANVRRLIDEFILHDKHALSFYPQLLRYGRGNAAWQELVKHIIDEQNFMLELFTNLRQQIR
ncbi:hypothetical protein Ccar_09325 [Clostridium carboxidivorans P7]|uniref:Hemerythrin-like domain-containing protein n=1 Tax=Clostridium carboxidivorans P7 TaxID=536227 RepID=C6PRN8_9CLOT|nr:DUF2935 domain-containing protein [Clostridium carboxidivorans]AKN31036.1 hypothetical protein Ccar_09325 [Clostridium carboxidivorans P7]EET88081.1 conserved hypothetical protein [Clostridium carboxidivorans P7]EFG88699.1 hypothetical protein CLCAR_1444 [Clostridium carboxidivorans P7]